MSTDSNILARARRPQHEANYLLHSTPLLSCSFLMPSLTLQCLELTCSMAALACLATHRTWRWTSGRLIRECTVWKPQDHCPLQLSGTTHKANSCRKTAVTGWIKLAVEVVGLQHSPSAVTNKAKVDSTSAEWLVRGTTRRGCLFALVSATPAGDGCGLLSIE